MMDWSSTHDGLEQQQQAVAALTSRLSGSDVQSDCVYCPNKRVARPRRRAGNAAPDHYDGSSSGRCCYLSELVLLELPNKHHH